MSTSPALYSPEEFSRRGQEIYDREVRPNLRPNDDDQFVAIDIESGSYEIDPDDFAATERLLASARMRKYGWPVSANALPIGSEVLCHPKARHDHRHSKSPASKW